MYILVLLMSITFWLMGIGAYLKRKYHVLWSRNGSMASNKRYLYWLNEVAPIGLALAILFFGCFLILRLITGRPIAMLFGILGPVLVLMLNGLSHSQGLFHCLDPDDAIVTEYYHPESLHGRATRVMSVFELRLPGEAHMFLVVYFGIVSWLLLFFISIHSFIYISPAIDGFWGLVWWVPL